MIFIRRRWCSTNSKIPSFSPSPSLSSATSTSDCPSSQLWTRALDSIDSRLSLLPLSLESDLLLWNVGLELTTVFLLRTCLRTPLEPGTGPVPTLSLFSSPASGSSPFSASTHKDVTSLPTADDRLLVQTRVHDQSRRSHECLICSIHVAHQDYCNTLQMAVRSPDEVPSPPIRVFQLKQRRSNHDSSKTIK